MAHLPDNSPLVLMMLDSASAAMKKGDLDFALEYSLAVIAVEPVAQAYSSFIEAALLVISRASHDSDASRLLAKVRHNRGLVQTLDAERFDNAFPSSFLHTLFDMARAIRKPEAKQYFSSGEVTNCINTLIHNIEHLLQELSAHSPHPRQRSYDTLRAVRHASLVTFSTTIILLIICGAAYAALLAAGDAVKSINITCSATFTGAAIELLNLAKTESAKLCFLLFMFIQFVTSSLLRIRTTESITLAYAIIILTSIGIMSFLDMDKANSVDTFVRRFYVCTLYQLNPSMFKPSGH